MVTTLEENISVAVWHNHFGKLVWTRSGGTKLCVSGGKGRSPLCVCRHSLIPRVRSLNWYVVTV